jgi:DNA-directed RNA polymerase specialized sigma subunit
MAEEPPKMKLNDFIVEYKKTGDGYYLSGFLYRFEQQILNGWAYKLGEKYGQLSRYQDIKQEMVSVLIDRIEAYDPTVGTTLLQFAKKNMLAAVHTYMRKNCGIYLLPEKYYQNLRLVSHIYYKDKDLEVDERIQAVIDQTGLPIEKVLRFIEESTKFRYPETIDTNFSDFERAKRTPIEYAAPDYLLLQNVFWEAVLDILENLRRRDYMLLTDYLGIDCPYCGRVHRPPFLGDIADKHQLRDEQSVTNRFRKIVNGIRVELERRGLIDGEHTPKAVEFPPKDDGMNETDRAVIDYAVKQREKSGKQAGFHMLFSEEKQTDKGLSLAFLKLWLY